MTYISQSINCALYFEEYLMDKCCTWELLSCEAKSELTSYVGQSDLHVYFIVQ